MAMQPPPPQPVSAAHTWTIDPIQSRVEFSVRKRLLLLKLMVKGRFTDLDGTLRLDERNPLSSRVQVHIAAASLVTGQGMRDRRLRGAKFFDAERYPTLEFSGGLEALDQAEGTGRLRGNLTIHGITRAISLDLTFEPVREGELPARLRVTARGELNRRDFGLGWNSLPIAIDDRVTLRLTIEATPA